jgi:hypothetical protein
MGLGHDAGAVDDVDGEPDVAEAMELAKSMSIGGQRVDVRDGNGRIVAVYRAGHPVLRVRNLDPVR